MTDRTYLVLAILVIGFSACHSEVVDPTEERIDETKGGETDPSESAGRPQTDFDGDGHADLAIGVPRDVVSGVDAGGVNVLYGSADGLTTAGDQLWNRDSPDVLGEPGHEDDFGAALATGDFDGDGHTDLAIGAPFDDVDSIEGAGAVNVLYGSANGLTAVGNQIWQQNSPGIAGEAGVEDAFGLALTSGDFDGDGDDDLAIGVPYEDPSGVRDAGTVHILLGSSAGLTEVGNQIWHQDISGLEGIAEEGDIFGWTLAAGDFNHDGHDDLAIGVPGEDVGDLADGGGVNVLYGSTSGLSGTGDQVWHQSIEGIDGIAESGDEFGDALAVGDFDGDGFEDLAVGGPGEDVGSVGNAGAVNTIYGSSGGLTVSGNQVWDQNQSGIEGVADPLDRFGDALAAGDFDGDGRDDLAVAAPGEDLSDVVNAGLVNVLYGSSSGLSDSGDQLWHQNIAGVDGGAESFDGFGSSLGAGDYDRDGVADLVIGAQIDDAGEVEDAGAVNVLYGSGAGLEESRDQRWHQDRSRMAGSARAGENFGAAVR